MISFFSLLKKQFFELHFLHYIFVLCSHHQISATSIKPYEKYKMNLDTQKKTNSRCCSAKIWFRNGRAYKKLGSLSTQPSAVVLPLFSSLVFPRNITRSFLKRLLLAVTFSHNARKTTPTALHKKEQKKTSLPETKSNFIYNSP